MFVYGVESKFGLYAFCLPCKNSQSDAVKGIFIPFLLNSMHQNFFLQIFARQKTQMNEAQQRIAEGLS